MKKYNAIKRVDVPLLFRLWHDKTIDNRALAAALEVSVGSLWDIKKRYALPSRKHERKKTLASDDPTESEILAACEAIQRGWTAEEREQRSVSPTSSWTPPVARMALTQ